MLLIYQIILSICLIFSPIVIILRILRNKEDNKRFIEKFGIATAKRRDGKLIWFHGSSVGEILSIIPIIKNYEKDKSISQILVTSSTISASKVIKKFKFKKTVHQFYPVDHFFFTRKFLKYWKPSIGIFIDSEIWPYMFNLLNYKSIPLILLNARLTKKTFNRWMKISFFSKSVFNKISVAYPQNMETKFYLKKLKTKKIISLGNIKFAENFEKKLIRINSKLKEQLKKRNIWVASSTHKNEEIFCVRAHIALKKKIKNLTTIIIPRHIHRVKEIISEIENFKLTVAIHSKKKASLKNIDIYIVDTFGETNKFHNISCSVFIGKSISKKGGQNPLEAARFAARILHGPGTENFKDVYKLLKSLSITKQVNTPEELASSILFKKNEIIGKKIKNIGKKILKKTIKELDSIINNETQKA